MDRVVPKVAGVEAPELMFKLSRRWGYEVKGISKNEAIIVAAKGNFHGRTVTAVSMSDNPDARNNFGPFVPGIELVPFNDFDALKELFESKGDNIAAFLAEPIQGEAGVIIPNDDYWPKVRALCNKHNILLALDEVQTGFGRTGTNFAHQLYNIKPDLMGCGKAAGGGILPVSFVSGTDEVIGVLTPGSEGSTFGGYPLGAVVGVYAIKVLIEERLAEKAKTRGAQLIRHFENMKSEFPDKIKDVRGKGLLTAFEMHDDPKLDGHHVSIKLLKKGVYAKETHQSTIRIAPALTIEAWQIDNIAEAIRSIISEI
jgi:ornithine--oxo-acid transaminase